MGTCLASRRLLAARSLKLSGWPRRRTGTPAILMSTLAGSNTSPERPAAAKMRPQLGSAPAKAVLTSGEVAMVAAIRLAEAGDFAPRTSISITRCAPSPSATICRARERQTSSRATRKARCAEVPDFIAGASAAPLARTSTVSLVEVSPSIEMALKVRSVTSCSVFCKRLGAMAASVATNASMVAMFGWIMPAPLAQPTRCTRLPAILKEALAVLGRVSVVQMASESSANERAEGRWWRVTIGRARRILSRGSGTPITPVEQTKNSCGSQFRRLAASFTVRSAAAWPAAPVVQLALPALTTTARMRPLEDLRCWREITTGAATTRFCVKTAAAEAGTSLDRIARSSAPVFFSPQAVAAKRKPRGRDDSERAWFKAGAPEALAWRTAKQPPALYAIGGIVFVVAD